MTPALWCGKLGGQLFIADGQLTVQSDCDDQQTLREGELPKGARKTDAVAGWDGPASSGRARFPQVNI